MPERRRFRTPCALALVLAATAGTGCQIWPLARYLLSPHDPKLRPGESVVVPGLAAPVRITLRADGLWRIVAASESDALTAQGYLMARDRIAQMDFSRHMARGELAALLGNRPLGGRTTLEVDRLNRFLGFRRDAAILLERTSPAERAALAAFSRGVNAWIAAGPLPLEHRLLGISHIRPWTPEDSVAIYLFLMHGLSSNADREVRRLVLACGSGLDAMERMWPTTLEFPVFSLPPDALPPGTHPVHPAIVPELAPELGARCAEGGADDFEPAGRRAAAVRAGGTSALASLPVVSHPGSASNSWVLAGTHTRSGHPVLSNDPHLPLTNPPVFWGVDVEHPGGRVAGFAIVGLHRLAIGHNGHVAWATTTNHVDRQDLVVHRARTEPRDGVPRAGYEVEGRFEPFELRTERFEVRGAGPVDVTVRVTRDGPLLNDLEPFLRRRIPLTALRVAPLGRGTDLDAAAAMTRAHTAAELAAALEGMDLGCQNWVFADRAGNIGYRSPCVLPVRNGWRGTFPVPGWLDRYRWAGFVPKEMLPAADNPARGWLVTANGQVLPSDRFFTAYNNDAAAPNRYRRIVDRLLAARAAGPLSASDAAHIAHDRRTANWAEIREGLDRDLCRDAGGTPEVRTARARLCAWDGVTDPDSAGATVFVLWTNALIDRALADEAPDGPDGPVWRWVQALVHFEANVQWLLQRPDTDPVWDDARTAAVESRSDIFRLALDDAAARGRRHLGADVDGWRWGQVRPFVLEHAFATGGGGLLGAVLNSPPVPVGGDTETVFKQQYLRSDRERLHAAIGPVVRITVDLGVPWEATYSLAGGQSGWPRARHYGDRVHDWAAGIERPLTPPPSEQDIQATLLPAPPG